MSRLLFLALVALATCGVWAGEIASGGLGVISTAGRKELPKRGRRRLIPFRASNGDRSLASPTARKHALGHEIRIAEDGAGVGDRVARHSNFD